MSDLLDAALGYLRRGWSVIPIQHKAGTNGKQPTIAWKKFQTRQPTEAKLRQWFAHGQKLDGLAVVLGKVSGGLVCRDFDTEGGYDRWAAAHADLAETLPTVKTARGYHVYFRSVWRGYIDLGDGELRGDSKHYCLLPPSIHPSGHAYRWLVPLPSGELPFIDPVAAGLLPETECTEETEETEKPISNDDHGSVLSVLSVSSSSDADHMLADQVEAAIANTLPTGERQRNRAVFNLARALKAIPAYADAPPAACRSIVAQWHVRALPVIGTKPFDETWADFVAAWPAVRFPLGQDPLSLVLDRADHNPPPKVSERYDAAETRRLVSVCWELQRLGGDAPFFLSARTAGRLVGLDHATAWRRLRMLEVDGVLSVDHRGDEHRATRYRFIPPAPEVPAPLPDG